jgi:hypothetical protein
MDTPHDRHPAYDWPPMPTEAELRAAMEESERDVAAGRTVPLADALAELDELADQSEARGRAGRDAHQAMALGGRRLEGS